MIDEKTIKKVGELSKLDLDSDELEEYGVQLPSVFEYIEQLKEVDTTGIEPTAQVTGLENVTRKDEIDDCDEEEREKSLEQAQSMSENQILVKKIL